MFEQAARVKLRFPTTKGKVTVEELWTLPMTSKLHSSLDSIAKETNRALKAVEEESFVQASTPANSLLELKMNILKHVIKVRLEESKLAANAGANKAKRDKILAIVADKQDEALIGLSVEELLKQADSLK